MMSPSRSRILPKVLLPILVLLVAVGATAALIASRDAPEPVVPPPAQPLVETVLLTSSDWAMTVAGHGEVQTATRVDLLAEVAGRVVWVHPRLVVGGRVPARETLVRIDPRDYELAVESARAAIASTETRLEQERAEASAALAEWRDIEPDTPAPTLLVREPQIRQLEAEKAAAQAQLARAELDLERTRLRVPFDAVVLTETVDPGQFLAQGRPVATLYGTEAVEIRVPLDDKELRWFDRPTANVKPAATVTADFAGEARTWRGAVDRLEGQVDSQTRLVHVVVIVEQPFASDPPLLPGIFVDIAIEGAPLEDALRVPRFALRTGGTLWTVEDESLRIRPCIVLRTEREHAYVRCEGASRLTVITSPLDGVTDGMPVSQAEVSNAAEVRAPEEAP